MVVTDSQPKGHAWFQTGQTQLPAHMRNKSTMDKGEKTFKQFDQTKEKQVD